MAPLGDLVGITRQTSVFAFQLAEYINPVLPTSGVTMGILGLPGLRRTISPAVEKSVTRREIGRGVSGILSE
ncbi:MAG: hypothetical protein IMZ57_03410 [Acidobacteria bacterium]|nr:hypothetical protein [Acidobacteriota bacterium]